MKNWKAKKKCLFEAGMEILSMARERHEKLRRPVLHMRCQWMPMSMSKSTTCRQQAKLTATNFLLNSCVSISTLKSATENSDIYEKMSKQTNEFVCLSTNVLTPLFSQNKHPVKTTTYHIIDIFKLFRPQRLLPNPALERLDQYWKCILFILQFLYL